MTPAVSVRSTNTSTSFVPITETIEAFTKIADGEYDHVPEQAFFLCGGLDDLERNFRALEKNS